MVVIRDAHAQDAQWIAALWSAVIAQPHITFTTTRKSPPEIADMIGAQRTLVLPDKAGFATYGSFRPGPGYAQTVEHTIILAAEAQGRGQGRALMDALYNCARAEGHHVMVAGVSSANPGAVAFHTRAGFAEVGRMPQVGHKYGQWLDLILMQKLLNPPDSAPDTAAGTG